jgi:hypothetical protein
MYEMNLAALWAHCGVTARVGCTFLLLDLNRLADTTCTGSIFAESGRATPGDLPSSATS